MTSIGIELHLEATPTSVEKLSGGKLVVTTDKEEKIEADAVMFGTGRNPNTKVRGGKPSQRIGGAMLFSHCTLSCVHTFTFLEWSARIRRVDVVI